MAIVQKSGATVNGATTVSPALTGVTAGNTLVLLVSAVGWTDATPTDSAGQTWSKAAYLSGSGCSVAAYYLLSANAGTHTLSLAAGGSTFVDYSLCEIPTCTAVDLVSTMGSATNTATTISSPSITTTNANDAIFALMTADTSVGQTNAGISDPPSGWVSVYAEQNTSANAGCQIAYKEVSATGAQSATWTFTADATGSLYQAAALAFKLAAAGGAALAGAGVAKTTGSASLVPKAQFSAAASSTSKGSATLTTSTAGAALVGAGTATSSGSASLVPKAQFSGAGSSSSAGSATLTVPGGSLTVTVKQKWSQQVSVGNPATLVFGSNPMTVTAGDTLICVTSGSDSNTQPTITDGSGTFTIPTNGRQNAAGSDNIWCSIAYQANASGGSHTITPGAVLAGGGGEIAHWVIEVTNMPATASIRGVFFTNAVNTSNSWSVSSDTSVQAGDIAFVMGMYENTAPGGTSDISNPPSGWTSVGFSELNSTTFTPTTVAYKVVPTSGVAVTANYSTSDPTISEHVSIMLVMVPNASSAAVLTGSGSASSVGSGALTTRAALAGAGSSTAVGSAALTVAAAFTAAASSSAVGSASLVTKVVLAAAASSQTAGSAALTIGGSLAGAGSSSSSGSASLTTSAAFSGGGSTATKGLAALTVAAALAGAGVAQTSGSAALTMGGALAGAGSSTTQGSASLTTVVALAGSGSSQSLGSAALTTGGSGAALAGSGVSSSTGAGSLTTAVSLSGVGVSASSGGATLTTGGSGAVLVGGGVSTSSGTAALTTRAALAGGGFSISTAAGVLTIGGPGVSFAAAATSTSSGSASLTCRSVFAGSGVARTAGSGVLALASPFVHGNEAVWLAGALRRNTQVPVLHRVSQAKTRVDS